MSGEIMDYKKYMIEYENKINQNIEKPLAFIVTGGGMEIFKIAQIPGASKILTSIFVPYCWDQSVKFISKNLSEKEGLKFKERAVSKTSAELLCKSGLEEWPGCRVIAVTAATTTKEYRKGNNHAFVSCGEFINSVEWINGKEERVSISKINTSYFQLLKLSEDEHKRSLHIDEIRLKEDKEITDFALKLAFKKITIE